jgi:hypothetical protein
LTTFCFDLISFKVEGKDTAGTSHLVLELDGWFLRFRGFERLDHIPI